MSKQQGRLTRLAVSIAFLVILYGILCKLFHYAIEHFTETPLASEALLLVTSVLLGVIAMFPARRILSRETLANYTCLTVVLVLAVLVCAFLFLPPAPQLPWVPQFLVVTFMSPGVAVHLGLLWAKK